MSIVTLRTPEPFACSVRAFGIVQAPPAMIAALRKKPAPAGDAAVFGAALKYADDQTVVSLAAVLQAIHDGGLASEDFTNWGVVAGPSFLGREALATSFKRFKRQGAVGVSPLLIPYLSQHAVAGTISIPLRIHGPNLGVCGDRGSLVQALLSGITLQREHDLPGVWVLASEWNPEPIMSPGQDTLCRAVALALHPANATGCGFELRLTLSSNRAGGEAPRSATIAGLAHFLTHQQPGSSAWTCALPWGASLEMIPHTASLARAA